LAADAPSPCDILRHLTRLSVITQDGQRQSRYFRIRRRTTGVASMDEGTVIGAVRIPTPWPPLFPLVVAGGRPDDHTEFAIVGQPNGSIRLTVSKKGSMISEYVTERVQFEGEGMAIISISWKPNWSEIRVNSSSLRKIEDAPESVMCFHLNPPVADPVLSYQHPHATTACADKIKDREIWFSNRAAGGSDKNVRPRTISDQLSDLGRSVRNVREYLVSINQGSADKLGTLAAEVRALTRRDGKYYNPLLSRMANYLKAPLPVYCMPDIRRDPTTPEVIKQANLHFSHGFCSVKKLFPSQVLMDLEDWLVQPAHIARPIASETGVKTRVTLVRDVVEDMANTMGVAHYSPDASPRVDSMMSAWGTRQDGLTVLLILIGNAVADLGGYLLDEAQNRDLT